MIRHLSLRDWLRWIQASRSEAVLRIRTPDGSSGTISCVAGKVVDANWGKLASEEALREMLGLASGAVTIDFEPIDRSRRSARPPPALSPLVEADLLQTGAAPTLPPAGMAVDAASHPSLTPVANDVPRRSHPLSSRWRSPAGGISRGEYLAGGLLLPALVIGAFAIGRLRASHDNDSSLMVESAPARQIKSGLLPPPPARKAEPAVPPLEPVARDLPVIAFTAIEVEPANAEVWLDHALVGLGRIELAPIRDGVLHELRFVAAGHAARSLYFVDAPPAGRVILERSAGAAPRSPALETPTPDTRANEPIAAAPLDDGEEEREPVLRRATRRRATAPPRRPPADSPAPAPSIELKQSPRVQLIEARTPHVQVLE
ncbi:MAG: hypothetical protein ABI895_22180 [Deltaproteobacteria bacterium]